MNEHLSPLGAVTAAHAIALRRSLEELIAESQALRLDVKTAEQVRRRENVINVGILGMLTLFVVLVLTVSWQNNQIAREVRANSAHIRDCTSEGGKCYEDGRRRSSAVIANLVHVQVAVAECARLYPNEGGPAYDAKLQACVDERAPGATPVPSPTPPER